MRKENPSDPTHRHAPNVSKPSFRTRERNRHVGSRRRRRRAAAFLAAAGRRRWRSGNAADTTPASNPRRYINSCFWLYTHAQKHTDTRTHTHTHTHAHRHPVSPPQPNTAPPSTSSSPQSKPASRPASLVRHAHATPRPTMHAGMRREEELRVGRGSGGKGGLKRTDQRGGLTCWQPFFEPEGRGQHHRPTSASPPFLSSFLPLFV